MSSTLTSFSQIETPVKYLRQIPLADSSTNTFYVTDASMSAFLAAETVIGSGLNSIVESADSPAVTATASGTLGVLVRDSGRKVTIVSPDAGNAVREVWTSVQLVSGSGSEGVPTTYATTGAFWIRTFADATASHNIEWARLG